MTHEVARCSPARAPASRQILSRGRGILKQGKAMGVLKAKEQPRPQQEVLHRLAGLKRASSWAPKSVAGVPDQRLPWMQSPGRATVGAHRTQTKAIFGGLLRRQPEKVLYRGHMFYSLPHMSITNIAPLQAQAWVNHLFLSCHDCSDMISWHRQRPAHCRQEQVTTILTQLGFQVPFDWLDDR